MNPYRIVKYLYQNKESEERFYYTIQERVSKILFWENWQDLNDEGEVEFPKSRFYDSLSDARTALRYIKERKERLSQISFVERGSEVVYKED